MAKRGCKLPASPLFYSFANSSAHGFDSAYRASATWKEPRLVAEVRSVAVAVAPGLPKFNVVRQVHQGVDMFVQLLGHVPVKVRDPCFKFLQANRYAEDLCLDLTLSFLVGVRPFADWPRAHIRCVASIALPHAKETNGLQRFAGCKLRGQGNPGGELALSIEPKGARKCVVA